MKVKMLFDVAAAYDHNHTRTYLAGEVYDIGVVNEEGDVLMPQWLADTLCTGGYHETKPVAHTTNSGITHVVTKEVPAAAIVRK